MRNKKIFHYALILAAVILVAGIVVGVVAGPKLDYRMNGAQFSVYLGAGLNESDVEQALKENGINTFTINKVGGSDGVMVSTLVTVASMEEASSAREGIENALKINYEYASVGEPSTYKEATDHRMMRYIALSALVAIIVIIAYMWFRFNWQTGLSAACIVLINVILTAAFCLILRIPINAYFGWVLFAVACLGAVGSMGILQRLEENDDNIGHTVSRDELIDLTLQETRFQTIVIIVVEIILLLTLMMSVAVYALPILVGVIVSLLSALFLTASLWDMFHPRTRLTRKVKKK